MVISKSQNYLNNKSQLPLATANMAKQVSLQRRAMLEEEVASGNFRDGSYVNNKKQEGHLSNVLVTKSGINKYANVISSSGTGAGFRGSNGDAVRQTPEVYSPLWLTSNLSLPRDKVTINAWCRAFFALNPIVMNAISLHSTYPISKLNIKCKDPKIEQFFNEMIEEIDLMNVCVQIAQEYWLLGEAFVYAELDETKGKWSRLLIQNPDNMVVKRTVVADEPAIYLRPDENLKRIISSNKPQDIEERKKINDYIVQTVKRNENILLPSLNISHIARRISPYEIRGTGLPVSIFRQLSLFDQIRECVFVQASSFINPITLVKVGSAQFKPSLADIQAYRDIFEQASYDKDMKIFTQNDVAVETINKGAGVMDTSNLVTQLIKEILMGLLVPSVLMDGGADTTYGNAGVALDVLRQRYMQFRNMLANWLKRKIFAPISKIQEFYEYKDKKKTLIIPDIDWNYMNLFDAGDYVNSIKELAAPGEGKRVSVQTLYRSLGLEYEDEVRKMKKEDIQEAIRKKELEALSKMPLNELRALTEDDEISEVVESPLLGEQVSEEAPEGGGEGGGMGGGLDLGGGGGGGLPGLDLGSPGESSPPGSDSGGGGAEPPPLG